MPCMLPLQCLKARLHVWPGGRELQGHPLLVWRGSGNKKLGGASTAHPSGRDVRGADAELLLRESLILLTLSFWSEFEL